MTFPNPPPVETLFYSAGTALRSKGFYVAGVTDEETGIVSHVAYTHSVDERDDIMLIRGEEQRVPCDDLPSDAQPAGQGRSVLKAHFAIRFAVNTLVYGCPHAQMTAAQYGAGRIPASEEFGEACMSGAAIPALRFP